MKRKAIGLIFGLGFLIFVKFWMGYYMHDEFGDMYIFIKHRPLFKTYFYSPRGMSDLKLSDMSAKQREEQIYFNEFILEEGLSR